MVSPVESFRLSAVFVTIIMIVILRAREVPKDFQIDFINTVLYAFNNGCKIALSWQALWNKTISCKINRTDSVHRTHIENKS